MDNLTHPYDSVIKLSQTDIDQIMDTAERIVTESDLPTIMKYVNGLSRMEQTSWFAKAHILYLVYDRWEEQDNGNFYEWASVAFGRAPETIRRMVEIWGEVIAKPKHTKKRLALLLTKPPSGLYYIKQAAEEGQLTEANWKDVELANNKQELREIMLEVRGPQRKGKTARKLMMEDDGILRTRKGNQAYKIFGRLNVEMENDPDIAEAIKRVINASGIFRH